MKIRGWGGPGADGSQVHIYWQAHSSYTDRGLTLSGNKNCDTLLLREVPSDIPLNGRPDFRGREGRSSQRVRPVRCVVWGSPPHTLGPSTPAETHRAHRVGTSPVQSQGPPGEAFFKPALSNQWVRTLAGPLERGEHVHPPRTGMAQTLCRLLTAASASVHGPFGGKTRYSDEK